MLHLRPLHHTQLVSAFATLLAALPVSASATLPAEPPAVAPTLGSDFAAMAPERRFQDARSVVRGVVALVASRLMVACGHSILRLRSCLSPMSLLRARRHAFVGGGRT